MERNITIALLVVSAAGIGFLKMEQLERMNAAEQAATELAEALVADAADAAELAEAAKMRFTVPHDSDSETNSVDILLDGSGSYDADNDSIAYHWNEVTASSGTPIMLDSGRASVSVGPGEYEFELTATDAYGSSTAAQKVVVVQEEPNEAPSASLDVYLDE